MKLIEFWGQPGHSVEDCAKSGIFDNCNKVSILNISTMIIYIERDVYNDTLVILALGFIDSI